MRDIAYNIKKYRQLAGLTLLELANKLGVKESTVQRYESGTIRNLKYDTIVQLSEIFGITPQALMGWEEESEKVDEFTDLANSLSESERGDVLDYIKFVISKRK